MLHQPVSKNICLQSCGHWNLLLPDVVDTPSLQAFKVRLDEIWQNKKFLYWVYLPMQWPQCLKVKIE